MNRKIGLLLAPLMTACVTSGTYKQLQRQYEAERAKNRQVLEQLALERMRSRSLEDARLDAEDRLRRLSGQISSNQQTMTAYQRRIAEERARQEALQKTLAEKESALANASALSESQSQALERYRQKFQKLVDAGTLQATIEDGRLVINLPSDILFASGSADVGESGYETLAKVGSIMASLHGKRLQVEGHTDNVPITSDRYPSNWHLAYARAMAVVKIFVEAGVQPGDISAASFSEFRPIASNDTEEGRAQNRRIEVVINPNLDEIAPTAELTH